MTREECKQRFFDWGYGLFIHFGLYSVYERGEWILYKERMDPELYRENAIPQFKPTKEAVRAWARFAAECGMNYAVLTTRHHDGYFIGDDIVRTYCEACRDYGLGVGLYYSVADWTNPDYFEGTAGKNWWRFVQKSHRQVKELMSNYGKIDYLFYDGTPPPDTWDILGLHREIRQMQPEMLICRGRADFDVLSREQNSETSPDLFESCYTLNHSWGYNRYDHCWKSVGEVVKLLYANRHNGGNLLMNIGPRADGSIPEESARILRAVGAWVKANQEAVFKIVPHPFDYADQELSTGKENLAYMMLNWEEYGPLRKITGVGNRVRKISYLDTGESMDFVQQDDIISLTGLQPRQDCSVPRIIKLEMDGKPLGIKNFRTPKLAMTFEGDRS